MSIFSNISAELYVPDGETYEAAFKRTKQAGVVAHQDDLELAAYKGIKECYQSRGFFGVVVTATAGFPRGEYETFSNEEMIQRRQEEQRTAAHVGRYSGVAQLNYPSDIVKEKDPRVTEDIRHFLENARPGTIYTHSILERSDTHLAVALRTIKALQDLRSVYIPDRFYGCEIWGSLDWLVEEDKRRLDVSGDEHLAIALLGLFDTQIKWKPWYKAALSRWAANATFDEHHKDQVSSSLIFSFDLMPLLTTPELSVAQYTEQIIERFKKAALDRQERLS